MSTKHRITQWHVSNHKNSSDFKAFIREEHKSFLIINKIADDSVNGAKDKMLHLRSFKASVGKINFVDFTEEHKNLIYSKVKAAIEVPICTTFRMLILVEDFLKVTQELLTDNNRIGKYDVSVVECNELLFVSLKNLFKKVN